MISGMARLRTDINGKVSGGRYGMINAVKNNIATILLIR